MAYFLDPLSFSLWPEDLEHPRRHFGFPLFACECTLTFHSQKAFISFAPDPQFSPFCEQITLSNRRSLTNDISWWELRQTKFLLDFHRGSSRPFRLLPGRCRDSFLRECRQYVRLSAVLEQLQKS